MTKWREQGPQIRGRRSKKHPWENDEEWSEKKGTDAEAWDAKQGNHSQSENATSVVLLRFNMQEGGPKDLSDYTDFSGLSSYPIMSS